MKLGLLSTSADCAALLRQALPGHDWVVLMPLDALAQARELALDALLIDLDALPPALHPVATSLPVLLLASPAQRAALHAWRLAAATAATDYLIKPIRKQELALRLDLLLPAGLDIDDGSRRVVQAAGFSIDFDRLHVSNPTRPALQATLTQKEADLALLLLSHLNRPLSRTFIQERVWGTDPELPSRTIDTHVSRVRNKLGLKPEFGFRLATVYGYGYQLEQLD